VAQVGAGVCTCVSQWRAAFYASSSHICGSAGQKKETRFIRLLAKRTIETVVAEVATRGDSVMKEQNDPSQLMTLLKEHPDLNS
jgi:hypothetical protein